MNERQWWNGCWSRLVRRDVFMRNSADGRWQVELRRGGPEGRRRVRSFGSEHDAVGWVEAAVLDSETGWREVGTAMEGAAVAAMGSKRALPRKAGVAKRMSTNADSRGHGKVAKNLDRAG